VTFFDRHKVFLSQMDWVRKHASDELYDIISDYSERVSHDWNVSFFFISTGKASDRIKNLVQLKQQDVKVKYPNVNLILWDFYGLKEEFIRSQSIEATISEAVDIQFPEDRFFIKDDPLLWWLFFAVMEKIAAQIRADKVKFFFLKRLRYWALALVPIHVEKRKVSIDDLLLVRDLIHAFQSAQEAKISNFAPPETKTDGAQLRTA
jgi:hypothetical protein